MTAEEYLGTFLALRQGKTSAADLGVDLIRGVTLADASAVLVQRAEWINRAVKPDTSTPWHRPVSRRSWSAKLGPIIMTLRPLYQRGWIRLPSFSPSSLT